VRGFNVDGTPIPGLSFLAYGTQKFGVNVAAGEIIHNPSRESTIDEIITGAGPGAVFGPHVRAFIFDEAAEAVSALPGISFFAYGANRWGVNVTAGNIDGDRYDEIVTGAGPGPIFGPHVRAWNVDNSGSVAAIPALSFLAYGTKRNGVNVTCGDVDGDGIDEIITAPGPAAVFGSHVRGWNYDGVAVAPLFNLSFFAWAPGEARYGARVCAGADLSGDWQDDIVVGCGPDPGVGTPVKVFWYVGYGDGLIRLMDFDAFPSGYTKGATVAAGRL
jgi:hypothetical protein